MKIEGATAIAAAAAARHAELGSVLSRLSAEELAAPSVGRVVPPGVPIALSLSEPEAAVREPRPFRDTISL